jgi:opacity protein-like surface antigen
MKKLLLVAAALLALSSPALSEEVNAPSDLCTLPVQPHWC